MLVITRRPGERVRIGDAWVTVLEVTARGAVRLGVEAPKDVTVQREEISAVPHPAAVKQGGNG